MIDSLFHNIWNWTASFPEGTQFVAVFLAGAIPLLEGHGAAALGVAVGVHPVIAATSAIAGNVVAMLAIALASNRLRAGITPKSQAREKRQKFMEFYDKYGVPVTALVAEAWLPAGLTTVLLIAMGASRRQVIIWQTISIIVWTVGMTLAVTGVISSFF